MNQLIRVSQFSLARCIVCCIGISALLTSPTLAQVDGPFDTIVNLPGDETIITGAAFEFIGGAVGETTQLNVSDGGTVGNDFDARVGGEVNVDGGTVGARFEAAAGSEVNILSGSVGGSFQAQGDSQVNISGGNVGDSLESNAGSEVNISGGNLSDIVARGSVNISGGTVDSVLQILSGGEVTISGGSVDDISGRAGSQLNLVGRNFSIDNEELENLTPGEASIINDRDVTISGFLADGQPFSYELGATFSLFGFFSTNATLTVTPIVILGDVNQDGMVAFSDISPFISLLSSGGFQTEADINQDNVVSFADISPFIGILSGS